jgi:hypothetical protein
MWLLLLLLLPLLSLQLPLLSLQLVPLFSLIRPAPFSCSLAAMMPPSGTP